MNQTPELIFRKMNFVAAKHVKTFSFPENSISGKQNIFRKCFYTNQIQPKAPNCCVEGAITDYFQINQFEKIFSNRDSLEIESHANKAFWDYQSFITASAYFQPYGFGTTDINRKFTGTKEVAAFLAHVATKTSREFKVSLL